MLELDISENKLDERSIETIKALIRYVKTLHKLNISKNSIPEGKMKELKKQIADVNRVKDITFF